MNVVYVKAVEDGGPHNAVRVDNSAQTIRIPDDFDVTPT